MKLNKLSRGFVFMLSFAIQANALSAGSVRAGGKYYVKSGEYVFDQSTGSSVNISRSEDNGRYLLDTGGVRYILPNKCVVSKIIVAQGVAALQIYTERGPGQYDYHSVMIFRRTGDDIEVFSCLSNTSLVTPIFHSRSVTDILAIDKEEILVEFSYYEKPTGPSHVLSYNASWSIETDLEIKK